MELSTCSIVSALRNVREREHGLRASHEAGSRVRLWHPLLHWLGRGAAVQVPGPNRGSPELPH